ncbi:MAG: glutamate-1-semialdehyde 2,1-aminomutase [Planctomycetes bacterium]|nr:glutamate-1-semialdehyde 2,1-aminomutase [Planctomycetota bacterium]
MNELFERAKRVIPGGVNSPVRAYKSVGLEPIFIAGARGAWVTDVDGKDYVDYVLSYGPAILGHAHPALNEALMAAIPRGVSYGAPTLGEVEIAEQICAMVPSVEMVRLVNSGTEATMSALRLARAATGRDRFIKFDGNYHGHGDGFLVKAGSGALTLGHPDSPGVPKSWAELTSVADYNDLASVRALLEKRPEDYAAIIVEPIAGNIGLVKPAAGFLDGLRALCDEFGALLIFDEVMTGFRVAPGGAQERFGVRPDLTTLGKVIGGGLPVGAYGGRRDLMEMVAPAGPMYQAGTLSGNPLAVSAGLTALRLLAAPGFFEDLERRSAAVEEALTSAAAEAGCPIVLNRVGSMFCPYFSETPVTTFAEVMKTDRQRHRRFFMSLLEGGVMPAPSPFEAWFVSSAHGEAEIEHTRVAARRAFRAALED